MAEQSLRSMIETWSRDEAALRDLIDSPEATAGRFGLTSLELGALRDADRLRSNPERQMSSSQPETFTITGQGTHMPSTQTLEPITITAGPGTMTTTPITITAGPGTMTTTPITITAGPGTMTTTPITITAGPGTMTTTPITITAGPGTITLSPLTITGSTDGGGQDEDPAGD